MSIKGISTYRTKPDWKKTLPVFIAIQKGEPVKQRKIRVKETRPRQQPETALRNAVIKELRRRGVKVMRLENAICGKHNKGVADLLVFNEYKRIGGFMELKSDKGILLPEQKVFREMCLLCNIQHWVVRSLVEAVEAVG